MIKHMSKRFPLDFNFPLEALEQGNIIYPYYSLRIEKVEPVSENAVFVKATRGTLDFVGLKNVYFYDYDFHPGKYETGRIENVRLAAIIIDVKETDSLKDFCLKETESASSDGSYFFNSIVMDPFEYSDEKTAQKYKNGFGLILEPDRNNPYRCEGVFKNKDDELRFFKEDKLISGKLQFARFENNSDFKNHCAYGFEYIVNMIGGKPFKQDFDFENDEAAFRYMREWNESSRTPKIFGINKIKKQNQEMLIDQEWWKAHRNNDDIKALLKFIEIFSGNPKLGSDEDGFYQESEVEQDYENCLNSIAENHPELNLDYVCDQCESFEEIIGIIEKGNLDSLNELQILSYLYGFPFTIRDDIRNGVVVKLLERLKKLY